VEIQNYGTSQLKDKPADHCQTRTS